MFSRLETEARVGIQANLLRRQQRGNEVCYCLVDSVRQLAVDDGSDFSTVERMFLQEFLGPFLCVLVEVFGQF